MMYLNIYDLEKEYLILIVFTFTLKDIENIQLCYVKYGYVNHNVIGLKYARLVDHIKNM